MDIRTKITDMIQKERLEINDITKQDFRKLLDKFKISPDIGYKINRFTVNELRLTSS